LSQWCRNKFFCQPALRYEKYSSYLRAWLTYMSIVIARSPYRRRSNLSLLVEDAPSSTRYEVILLSIGERVGRGGIKTCLFMVTDEGVRDQRESPSPYPLPVQTGDMGNRCSGTEVTLLGCCFVIIHDL
jgi:hypothetical protein